MPENSVFIGNGSHVQSLLLSRANRHGLIAGATGTGKTVTLQILAEGFSAQGVPVFMADVKGDLSGISQPGTPKPALLKRAEKIGLEPYTFHGFPTVFWDVFGVEDHPMRATSASIWARWWFPCQAYRPIFSSSVVALPVSGWMN